MVFIPWLSNEYGFWGKVLLVEINHPLTDHQKLELRMSMPRELWPQKWRDEEAEVGG